MISAVVGKARNYNSTDTDAAKVIIEKNTKGAQIPMYMKTVSLNGENYVVFFGWGDTTATCVFNPNSL